VIVETTTMLTDYLLAVAAIFFYYRIPVSSRVPIPDWSRSFIILALASIAGGTAHGFAEALSPLFYTILWKLTLVSVGLANFYLINGTLNWWLERTPNWAIVLNYVKTTVYLILISFSDLFMIAAIDYAITITFVVGIVFFFHPNRDIRIWIVLSYLIALLTGIIWVSQIQILFWFNQNGLAHLAEIGSIYAIYKVLLYAENENALIGIGNAFELYQQSGEYLTE